MAKPRSHLAQAPIVEALIDLRVIPRDQITPNDFESLTALVGSSYSEKAQIASIQMRFGMDGGRPIESTSTSSVMGWLYKTESNIAQFRVDGFTFSRIEPYTSWQEVFDEAFRLWNIYVQVANPKQVSRIAVRYINRMRLTGSADLKEFLEAPPIIPKPIPQRIREFLSRTRVDDTARKASAVIIQALEPQVDPSTISLILDIYAFKDGLTLLPDDSSIPAMFGQLRELKNEIFFASITERTAENYE